jgi:hypothetical protein
MLFATWPKKGSRRPGRLEAGCRFRPALEALEERALLSTFTVVDLGDGGTGSGLQGDLRYCVNAANTNNDLSNRIVFQPGVSGTLSLVQGRLFVDKNLEIDGPGADLLTISGSQLSSVFEITNDPRAQNVRLAGVTIADGIGIFMGFAYEGGGLFNWHADVTLTNCVFTHNAVGGSASRGQGGAIYTMAGHLVLNHCTVSDNSADGPDGTRAGAIYVADGTLTLDHCLISGNSSSKGVGAIFNNGVLTATDTTVSDNVGQIGGAIEDEFIMTWTRSTIADNVGTASAGGVNANGIDTFINCTIANNQTPGVGGGLYNGGTGQLTLTGSTISGNSAAMGGGGLWWAGGAVIATNSTFSGNSADSGTGGAILMLNAVQRGSLEMTSCTLSQNRAAEAGGLEVGRPDIPTVVRNTIIAGNQATDHAADVMGTVLSLGHNQIGDADSSTGWQASDLTGSGDNPLDPRLGPLQDNGGPTWTQAPFAGSPAIDNGDPVLYRSLDQRGTFRIFDGTDHGPDIGAVEAENAVAIRLIVPGRVTAGQPFGITVVALDQWGNTATTYAGTVHFDSTDLSAVLPDDYPFSTGDQGVQTFGVTLNTPGIQSLRVHDVNDPQISKTVTIQVDSPSAPGGPPTLGDLVAWQLDGAGWHRRSAL